MRHGLNLINIVLFFVLYSPLSLRETENWSLAFLFCRKKGFGVAYLGLRLCGRALRELTLNHGCNERSDKKNKKTLKRGISFNMTFVNVS